MPLVKSPAITPRKLTANHANALKSTGPRTAEGKCRVMLNGLRHGCYSRAFRPNLLKARQNVELFDWIHQRLGEEMPGLNPHSTEYLARQVWCGLCRGRKAGQRPRRVPPTRGAVWSAAWTPWRVGGLAAKPRYAVKSTDTPITFLSPRSRIRIEDPRSQRRLMFWVRRRRGTRVRLPVTAWPEIAASVLRRRWGLQAGEQQRRDRRIRGSRVRALRALKE